MRTVTVTEARARFGSLLTAVEHGEVVTITRRGVPVAVMAPVHSEKPSPTDVDTRVQREDWSDWEEVGGPDPNGGS